MSDEVPGQAETRRRLLSELGKQAEERRRAEDWARRGKECPIQRPMFDRLF